MPLMTNMPAVPGRQVRVVKRSADQPGKLTAPMVYAIQLMAPRKISASPRKVPPANACSGSPLVMTMNTPTMATAMQPRVKFAGRVPFSAQCTNAAIGVCSAMMMAACSGRDRLRPTNTSTEKPLNPTTPKNAAFRNLPR